MPDNEILSREAVSAIEGAIFANGGRDRVMKYLAEQRARIKELEDSQIVIGQSKIEELRKRVEELEAVNAEICKRAKFWQDDHEAITAAVDSLRKERDAAVEQFGGLREELRAARACSNAFESDVERLTTERDAAVEAGKADKERADANWTSCERIKEKLSDHHNELSALRTKLEAAEKDELHEIEQRDYREDKFGELVGIFGDVQLEFSNLRGFDEIIADCEVSLLARDAALRDARDVLAGIAEFIPSAPQSYQKTLEQVIMMADTGEQAATKVIAEWERINDELYPHASIDAAMLSTQEGPDAA